MYCTLKAYSYGDSAGFTPDFPFNGATRQPITWANVGNKNICQMLLFFFEVKIMDVTGSSNAMQHRLRRTLVL
jgi:hypothetical protein